MLEMRVNPILMEALDKQGTHDYIVHVLAQAIKDGRFPPGGDSNTLFPKYTLFGHEVSDEVIREARLLALTQVMVLNAVQEPV